MVSPSPKMLEHIEQHKEGMLFQPIFYDMAGGDKNAGLMLSQIIYWYRTGNNGDTKLRVKRKNGLWLVKQRTDWFKEIRCTEYEIISATKKLVDCGLIVLEYHFFKGIKQTHIQVVEAKYFELFDKCQAQILDSNLAN